jgi:hypothetical protein
MPVELRDQPAECVGCGRPRSRLTHFDLKARFPVTTEVLWCANPSCKCYGRHTVLGHMSIQVIGRGQRSTASSSMVLIGLLPDRP